MNHREYLCHRLQLSLKAKQDFLLREDQLGIFEQVVTVVINAYRQGGRLYIAGNGGSAADAQHLATEFVSKLARDRAPLPAEALTTDSSTLTAIGNDYGFAQLFARQIAAKVTPKDVFLAITTSGRSENINVALKQCREQGAPSILFCGRDGGTAKALADYCILATGEDTNTIQEMHIVLAHSLCGCVELALFPETP